MGVAEKRKNDNQRLWRIFEKGKNSSSVNHHLRSRSTSKLGRRADGGGRRKGNEDELKIRRCGHRSLREDGRMDLERWTCLAASRKRLSRSSPARSSNGELFNAKTTALWRHYQYQHLFNLAQKTMRDLNKDFCFYVGLAYIKPEMRKMNGGAEFYPLLIQEALSQNGMLIDTVTVTALLKGNKIHYGDMYNIVD